jgi:polyisoprenoid-binding protein YceI
LKVHRTRLTRPLAVLMVLLAASAAGAPAAPLPTYSLDATKSTLEFAFVQAGGQNKGRFPKLAVNFSFADDNLAASHLEVTVDVAALDTADQDRDDTLRGADLFDVATFPQARFAATQITKTAASAYEASGSLVLRGVTHALRLPITLRSATEQGRRVLYMTGKTLIKRLDFGVGQGEWKSTEGVDNEVNVTFNLRLVAAN